MNTSVIQTRSGLEPEPESPKARREQKKTHKAAHLCIVGLRRASAQHRYGRAKKRSRTMVGNPEFTAARRESALHRSPCARAPGPAAFRPRTSGNRRFVRT